MRGKEKASIIRVILVDVIANVCAIMLLCILVFYALLLFGLISTQDVSENSYLFLIASSAFFSLPMIYRIRLINLLLHQGIECDAKITKIVRANTGDGIWYEYAIGDQTFNKYYVAIFYKCNIDIGDIVTVVVDKNDYKRSRIKCLFV